MPNEPVWLSADAAVAINQDTVAATGEPYGLRDLGLLESACGVPVNRRAYGGEEDIVRLAVSLMLAIARNHPFQQGNKRTGFLAGAAFLSANGYELAHGDTVEFADLFVSAIQYPSEPHALEDAVRRRLVAREED